MSLAHCSLILAARITLPHFSSRALAPLEEIIGAGLSARGEAALAASSCDPHVGTPASCVTRRRTWPFYVLLENELTL
jgi:hypothetical protein